MISIGYVAIKNDKKNKVFPVHTLPVTPAVNGLEG